MQLSLHNFHYTHTPKDLYLDEQGLVGGLHGLLRGLELSLELGGLDSGLI